MKTERIIDKIKSFSLLAWKNKFYRHLLFAIATLISLFTIGYYFGTFDQASHIPFLKKFADPSLYPNDYFLNLRLYHYSFFWLLFLPFYKLGILEITMFIVYISILYLTFWGLWNISKKLFNSPLTSFLTIIVFTLPHVGFSGLPLIEFSLLNRTFVLPFLLMAINLYLDKRYILAFFLLGILYNLHVVSVNFVLFMFLFASIIKIKKVGLKNIIVRLIIFIIGALPVLLWKVKGSPVELGVNSEWFWIISRGILYHMFYFVGSNLFITLLPLGGISSVILFIISRNSLKRLQHTSTITLFMLALFIILIIQTLASYVYPSTIIIQSQLMRAGVFILIFSLLYFIHYIVTLYESKKINNLDLSMFSLTTIFSLSPAALLVVWLTRKILSPHYWATFTTIITTVVFISIAIMSFSSNIWRPGIYIFPPKSSFYDVQLWARAHSQRDDIFITPPYKEWFYEIAWRAGSERSTLVSLFDLAEIAIVPSGLSSWKERFARIAPEVIDKFEGDVFSNYRQTYQAYYSLSAFDFKQIAKTFKASYIVVEKPHLYNLPKVYENEGYLVYDLRKVQ